MKKEIDSLPLHLKYRPKTFDEVVGNEDQIKLLKAVLNERKATTFLLQGPSGTGKTTIARIIKSELGCSDIDYHEINTADNRGIETIRDLIHICSYQPIKGDTRVILLDECHQISGSASDALLKLIEEAPYGTFFVLATTEPGKLSETLKGRCSSFNLKLLDDDKILYLILSILVKEEKEVSEDVISHIAIAANGCPREALQILGQVIVLDNEEEMISAILSYSITGEEVIELSRSLLNGTWKDVSKVLSGFKKEDSEKIRRSVLSYMMKVVLSDNRSLERAAAILENFKDPTFNTGMAGIVLSSYRCFGGNYVKSK